MNAPVIVLKELNLLHQKFLSNDIENAILKYSFIFMNKKDIVKYIYLHLLMTSSHIRNTKDN